MAEQGNPSYIKPGDEVPMPDGKMMIMEDNFVAQKLEAILKGQKAAGVNLIHPATQQEELAYVNHSMADEVSPLQQLSNASMKAQHEEKARIYHETNERVVAQRRIEEALAENALRNGENTWFEEE